MDCTKCGATYRVQRSAELAQNVRNLCRCEAARVCGYQKKGKAACGPARQALLDIDGNVELYVCERHAAQDALDDPAPPRGKTKSAAEPKPTGPTTEAEYAAFVAVLDHEVTCGACGDRHPYGRRTPKRIPDDKHHLFELHCPGCGVGEYGPDGPPWVKTYRAEGYVEPDAPPAPVPKPARKKKR